MFWVCSYHEISVRAGISMRAEGSKNISPWFSRFISDSITMDMLLQNDGKVIKGTHLS